MPKRKTHNKQNLTTRMDNVFFRFIVIGVSVYFAYTCFNLFTDFHRIRSEEKQAKQEIQTLKNEIKFKRYEVEHITDQEMIEKAARERFGYVYPNEVVFIDISGN